jgi:hypothetical protein
MALGMNARSGDVLLASSARAGIARQAKIPDNAVSLAIDFMLTLLKAAIHSKRLN